MSLSSLAGHIQQLPFSAAMRGESAGTSWLFPIVETCHLLMLAMVFGSIAALDLRLLGIASAKTPVQLVAKEWLPFTWIAWVGAAITGAMMFCAKAVEYLDNLDFRMKMLCMTLAFLNMLTFHFGVNKTVSRWGSARHPPIAARIAGGLSITFWLAVICFGRWIGFTS
jgi:hypothetical protein